MVESKKKKMTDSEKVRLFLYAPVDTKTTFPCHCGGTIKMTCTSNSHGTGKCENGHYLAMAWGFVSQEPPLFANYMIVRTKDDG